MKNRILAFGLSAIMAFSATTAVSANWYDNSMSYVSGINAVNELLEPGIEMNLEQFAELYVRAATYEHGEDPISVMVRKGLIAENERFAKNAPITRDEAVRIIMRSLGVEGNDYLLKAREMGIVHGYPDGSVSSERILTFAEASQLVYGYRNYVESELNNQPVNLYSAEEFFQLPGSMGYSITKDGKYLIFAAPWQERINIFKKDLESGETTQVTKITDRNLAGYYVKDNTILYLRDFGGNENYHIFRADENGNEVDLTPFEDTLAMPLDLLDEAKVKDEILIQMNKDNKQVFSVYRLNVVTGDIQKVLDNTVGYTGYITDIKGNVRIALISDGTNEGYFYRDSEEEEFQPVAFYDFREQVTPIMFCEDNQTVYAISNIGRNTAALVKIDPKTAQELEVVFQHDTVDVGGIRGAKKPGSIGAVTYYTDKLNKVFLDEELKGLYDECETIMETDDEITVSSFSEDWSKVLVFSSSDVNRGRTFMFDRKSQKLEKLTDVNVVNSDDMATMIPVSYKSRDGLTIHGYLTLPKNMKPYNLPVIVNPHGGPWARDTWGYNTEVQFLANRGYAVLQINFRGSIGYGKQFLEAGYKQWGLNMQNDITDGVEWLKSIGLADPRRIGIYGGSYGGYATLAGIAFTPDLYAAAVDYVGVSNLFTFLNTIPPYWESMRDQLYVMVGNPETDMEQFQATSPVFHADKIKTPLFIAQGANDPRVNKDESDQMVKALQEKGVEVEYMVKDNEGHGFSNFENQIDFYTKMEEFFSIYLGGTKFE